MLVLGDPVFKIVSMSGVEDTATAVEHVGPEWHMLRLSEVRPFDKLRANGVFLRDCAGETVGFS
ncbi:MAG: hypothetical protein KJZ64_13690 [Sphingomonadaceae bacterium]|nr:hypothetical protein [Sphingomonadaceae bacterium]